MEKTLAFYDALYALETGARVERLGWNGRGMWVIRADGGNFKVGDRIEGSLDPFLVMKNAAGDFVPWVASQADIVATDWRIVEGQA